MGRIIPYSVENKNVLKPPTSYRNDYHQPVIEMIRHITWSIFASKKMLVMVYLRKKTKRLNYQGWWCIPNDVHVFAYGWKTEPAFACFYEFHGVKGVGWGGVEWANNVHLHYLTYMMLRYCTSSCTASHTWCYATVTLLALPHIHGATLL